MLLLAFLLLPALAQADGGAIVAREKLDGMTATVFLAPVPLRAGPADVSVLLQDEGNRPVLNASVQTAWVRPAEGGEEWLPPCCSMSAAEGWQPATRGHSQNKLLYSAFVPIKNSGRSQLAFRIGREGKEQEFVVNLDAASPASPWTACWPFLAFPPVAIAGYALNRRLAKKNQSCKALAAEERRDGGKNFSLRKARKQEIL